MPQHQPYPVPVTGYQQPQQQQYGYSGQQGGGRKKAVLIGINYFGTAAELRGCINDVGNVKGFLASRGFVQSPENMKILTDDQHQNSPNFPTKQNMIAAMKWLVSGAQPGDLLFLHYSGHGGQQRDTDNDEADQFDETIIPVDFKQAGQLVDDDLHDILVKPLPKGVKLIVIFDSCHSGTALDLPYIYGPNGQLIDGPEMSHSSSSSSFGKPNKAQLAMGVVNMGMNLLSGNGGGLQSTGSLVHGFQRRPGYNVQNKISNSDVIMFSSCRDDQTSMDVQTSSGAIGAMSHAIIQALQQNPNPTYGQLLSATREILKGKYQQIPQLSSSHAMDMNQLFAVVNQ